MKLEQCKTCYFLQVDPGNVNVTRMCCRFPQAEDLTGIEPPFAWCGEYRADGDKLCLANGPELEAAREAIPGVKNRAGDLLMPGLPARRAVYRSCWRETGHPGKHSDGSTYWE